MTYKLQITNVSIFWFFFYVVELEIVINKKRKEFNQCLILKTVITYKYYCV